MKAKLHSRKSCGHEWGQFIIHAYTHTQTGVTIKTVQLFCPESRIKRLSTPRDPWEPRTSWEEQGAHSSCHCQQCLLWLSVRDSSFCCTPVLWLWWLVFCPLAFVVSDVCQLVRHGRAHKSWEASDVHLLKSGWWKPAFLFDCFVSIVALFESVKEWKNYKPLNLTLIKFVLNVTLLLNVDFFLHL